MAESTSIKATLTRKIGGVPTYVYLGIGTVALAYFLIQRHNRKAAQAAAAQAGGEPTSSSNAATQIPNVPLGGQQGMSGLPWQYGPVYENYNPGNVATSQPAGVAQGYDPKSNTYNGVPLTPISGEKLMGGGYTDPTGFFYEPIVTSQGFFQFVDTAGGRTRGLLATLLASGAPVFAQTAGGIFTPVDPSKVDPTTPLYQQLPGIPYSPTHVANPAVSAAVNPSPTAAATR